MAKSPPKGGVAYPARYPAYRSTLIPTGQSVTPLRMVQMEWTAYLMCVFHDLRSGSNDSDAELKTHPIKVIRKEPAQWKWSSYFLRIPELKLREVPRKVLSFFN